MEVVERVRASYDNKCATLSVMQFGFVPGRGTMDNIFILRQQQINFRVVNKTLYMAFVDVPRRVISSGPFPCLALRSGWVCLIHSMHENAISRVCFHCNLSKKFSVKVGVNQGSYLSPYYSSWYWKPHPKGLRAGCPWENWYGDDLIIISKIGGVTARKADPRTSRSITFLIHACVFNRFYKGACVWWNVILGLKTLLLSAFMRLFRCRTPGPLFTQRLRRLTKKISWSREATRFDVLIIVSLRNLAGILTALLPRYLSSLGATGRVWIRISWLRDFTRSGGKTSVRLMNRALD